MAYSKDYKECAVRYKLNNHTFEETHEIFGMAESTLYEWIKEYEAGFPENLKRTYEKKINKEVLKKAIEEQSDNDLRSLPNPLIALRKRFFTHCNAWELLLKKDLHVLRKI